MMKMMKCALLFAMFPSAIHAQSGGDHPKLKRIYFNLYTDSIKTILNYYVNVEGEYRSGRVLPMDTGIITITADHGIMSGNEWIAPKEISFEKVIFHTVVKNNPAISDEVTVWLKRGKDSRDDMDLPVVPEDIRKRRR